MYVDILGECPVVRYIDHWNSSSSRIVFSAFSPTCSAMLTKFWLRKQVPWKKSQAVGTSPVLLMCGEQA